MVTSSKWMAFLRKSSRSPAMAQRSFLLEDKLARHLQPGPSVARLFWLTTEGASSRSDVFDTCHSGRLCRSSQFTDILTFRAGPGKEYRPVLGLNLSRVAAFAPRLLWRRRMQPWAIEARFLQARCRCATVWRKSQHLTQQGSSGRRERGMQSNRRASSVC